MKKNGFTLIEMLLVVAIVGILAAIAIPQLLQAREKARESTCDAVVTAIVGEVANVLDDYNAEGSSPNCPTTCSPNPSSTIQQQLCANAAAECVWARHAEDVNPRNRLQPLYVDQSPLTMDGCQVQYLASTNPTAPTPGPYGPLIEINQVRGPNLRTKIVTLD